MLSPSSGLPMSARPMQAPLRPGYELFMAQAIPGALIAATVYLVHAGYEYVLVPWLGRVSTGGRIFTLWSCMLIAFAWCGYYYARTTDAGSVPSELSEHMRLMPREARTPHNYCDKCENVKPPRAHHCRRCKKCTLRMDHHCVALNNCIGLYNWKYFVSAFFYLFLSAVHGLLLMAVRFIAHPHFDPTTYERAHCLAFTFGCAFLAWTGYKHANRHINLALLNLTSIEYQTLPAHISLNYCQRYGIAWSRISNFDKGWRHNLIMVLGEPVITWFLPFVAPRSPWGPLPPTWYSGFTRADLYDMQPSRGKGPQVTGHNHNMPPNGQRNAWAMYDEPVQHAAEGLLLNTAGSMPLFALENGEGHSHDGGGHDHGHGGGYGDHGHSHGGGGGGGHHGHSHGGDDDDMPGLIDEESGHHGHSHGGHGHSHGGGGHHGHSH